MKKLPIILYCTLIVAFAVICSFAMHSRIETSMVLIPRQDDTPASIANPINVNTATAQELMLLPGVGENLANKIIDYRHENGDFQAITDIMNVPGIGQDTLNSISKYITVGE